MYYQTNNKQTRVKFVGAAGCSRVLCRRAGAGNDGLFVDALRPRPAGLFLFGCRKKKRTWRRRSRLISSASSGWLIRLIQKSTHLKVSSSSLLDAVLIQTLLEEEESDPGICLGTSTVIH